LECGLPYNQSSQFWEMYLIGSFQTLQELMRLTEEFEEE
jgi:hypothetical protein